MMVGLWSAPLRSDAPKVRTVRVPDGGLQPQVAVGADGALHLIYFRGPPESGDLFYVASRDGGRSFGKPLKVNRGEGSAVALGNIRGAQLALGRKDRVHVAWMGSRVAEPKAPGGQAPMLYTRLAADGLAFEPERNLISKRVGIDGGGFVAADGEGRVYVAWHAPAERAAGEGGRRVWLSRPADDGASFASEEAVFDEPTGACGCCGMKAYADRRGRAHILYRSARETVNRDIYLLSSSTPGGPFRGVKVHPWPAASCMMSMSAFAEFGGQLLCAWETEYNVYFAKADPETLSLSAAVAASGESRPRKFPVLAVDKEGRILLAWAEGMGWGRGGAAAWQIFDAERRPLAGAAGRAGGVPAWSLVAACVDADGVFVTIY
jgi:hypothetical protein